MAPPARHAGAASCVTTALRRRDPRGDDDGVPADSPGGSRSALPPLAGEEHVCASCPFAFADQDVDRATSIIGDVPAQARRLLGSLDEAAIRRRQPDRWSAVEYLCHVRDVYATFTIRLHRARTEDDPVLEPMLNDLRARRFGYRDAAVEPVLDELQAYVAGFLAEVARVRPEDWGRPVHRLPDEHRSALWLVRQAAHEGVHHLHDIAEVARER
jgi:DinB superfamily